MYTRCFNNITVLGPAEEIKRFVDANVGHQAVFYNRDAKEKDIPLGPSIFTMNAFLPVPTEVIAAGEHPNTGKPDQPMYGLEWKKANWGTEWDADHEGIMPADMGYSEEYPGCELRFSFEGKACPPDKWFAAVTAAFPALTLSLNYSSYDGLFRGWLLGMNGTVTSRHFKLEPDVDMLIPPDDEDPWGDAVGAERIPNELAAQFNTVEGRKKLIELYGDRNTLFSGVNSDGEDIQVSFDRKHGIELWTNQRNGWTRINYYDAEGIAAGETFDGRWKTNEED